MIDDKIKTFIHVVECQNYTQAAHELHLTQPAVSQHIKTLESYYQHKLIENPHKSFQLTKAGEMLYTYAKMQLHNEELFVKQLAKHTSPLIIGSTLSIADYYLPSLIAKDIVSSDQQYQIVVANTKTLIQKMLDGEVDCAFVEGQFDTNIFDYHLFKEERFIPIARINHPLSNQSIAFEDLLKYPLFIREQGSGTRSILENYLSDKVYQIDSFEQTIEIGSLAMIKTLVANTNGMSFVYEGVVKKEIENHELIELNIHHFQITKPMHFIYLRSSLNKSKYQNLFDHIKNNPVI
ncbi:MAG: LysR substrate-binding domain-containing protein [Longibaculum sp.]